MSIKDSIPSRETWSLLFKMTTINLLRAVRLTKLADKLDNYWARKIQY